MSWAPVGGMLGSWMVSVTCSCALPPGWGTEDENGGFSLSLRAPSPAQSSLSSGWILAATEKVQLGKHQAVVLAQSHRVGSTAPSTVPGASGPMAAAEFQNLPSLGQHWREERLLHSQP